MLKKKMKKCLEWYNFVLRWQIKGHYPGRPELFFLRCSGCGSKKTRWDIIDSSSIQTMNDYAWPIKRFKAGQEKHWYITSVVIALQIMKCNKTTKTSYGTAWMGPYGPAHSPDKTYYIKWTGRDRPTSADKGFLGVRIENIFFQNRHF